MYTTAVQKPRSDTVHVMYRTDLETTCFGVAGNMYTTDVEASVRSMFTLCTRLLCTLYGGDVYIDCTCLCTRLLCIRAIELYRTSTKLDHLMYTSVLHMP